MEMNEKKEYLSEEENQRISKKIGLISKIMLFVGIIGFITCSVLLFGNFISFEVRGMVGFAWVGCAACAGFGLVLFTAANQRKISAYMTQQQMPIAQEGIEKMAPSVGGAAKEVVKGIKEGLNEADKKEEEK